jgi:uncharacterized RDD family membrane protein YckC
MNSNSTQYGSQLIRLGARIIDYLIFVPFLGVQMLIVESHETLTSILWLSFSYLIEICYFAGMHSYYGKTLGKKLLGITVLNSSYSPISLKQAILRETGFIIVSVLTISVSVYDYTNEKIADSDKANLETIHIFAILWILAELLSMELNSKKRALRDYIADTLVVVDTKDSSRVLPADITETQ